MSEDNGEDIGELLRKIPQADYPRDLKTATRAEYTTMVNTMQKKDGCGKQAAAIILILTLLPILTYILLHRG